MDETRTEETVQDVPSGENKMPEPVRKVMKKKRISEKSVSKDTGKTAYLATIKFQKDQIAMLEKKLSESKETIAALTEELEQLKTKRALQPEAKKAGKTAPADRKEIVLINVNEDQEIFSNYRVNYYAAAEVKKFLENTECSYEMAYVNRKGLQVSQLRKLTRMERVKICDNTEAIKEELEDAGQPDMPAET